MMHCFAGGRGAVGVKGSPGSPGSAGLPGFPVRFHGYKLVISIGKTEHSGNMIALHTQIISLWGKLGFLLRGKQ
jgi:hypothetical protein